MRGDTIYRTVLLVAVSVLLATKSAASEKVKDISEENFEDYLDNNNLVVVKFFANWCPHCVESEEPYEEAASLVADSSPDVKMTKMDVDKNAETRKVANEERVNQLPSMLLFKDGKNAASYSGDFKNAKDVADWVKEKSK